MLNILINAYACSPNWGSEQGMAWNWIKNLSLYCNLYVITEGEYKDLIEKAVSELPQKENLHFYYNPVSDKIRKMCWNQGDWRFYYYYQKWQYSTYLITLDIIKENHIDVIHQLNMIGFREPGYLWKIKDIPFVWGPIGGMENVPVAYLKGEKLKQKLSIILKNLINTWQAEHHPRVRKAIHRADILIAAVKGVERKIQSYYNKSNVILINETGCDIQRIPPITSKSEHEDFNIMWVGKFDFRKQLGLAIQILTYLKAIPRIKLHIYGSGSEKEQAAYKCMASELGVEELCVWHGKTQNTEVKKAMKDADLFLFTSIMEATSTVVLEAIGNQLPVLCFNTCGFGPIVNSSVGVTIELSNPKQSAIDFASAIRKLYKDRILLDKMSQACIQRQEELSWNRKSQQVVEIYKQIVN